MTVYRVAYGEASAPVALAAPVGVTYDPEETLAAIPQEERAALSAAGEKLFRQYVCISCHSRNGRGLKKLDGIGERYNLATLDRFLEKPNPPMPIFPLDVEDRRAMSVYLIETYPRATVP